MEVILLERIRNLGTIGEEVDVAAGYVRNCLLPQKKAILANERNRAEFAARRDELEQCAQEIFAKAKARAEMIMGLEQVMLKALASEEGKLFGSVGTREIAEAVTAAGVAIEKIEVLLPMGVIRTLGEHDVQLQLHTDLVTQIKIVVVPEK